MPRDLDIIIKCKRVLHEMLWRPSSGVNFPCKVSGIRISDRSSTLCSTHASLASGCPMGPDSHIRSEDSAWSQWSTRTSFRSFTHDQHIGISFTGILDGLWSVILIRIVPMPSVYCLIFQKWRVGNDIMTLCYVRIMFTRDSSQRMLAARVPKVFWRWWHYGGLAGLDLCKLILELEIISRWHSFRYFI